MLCLKSVKLHSLSQQRANSKDTHYYERHIGNNVRTQCFSDFRFRYRFGVKELASLQTMLQDTLFNKHMV